MPPGHGLIGDRRLPRRRDQDPEADRSCRKAFRMDGGTQRHFGSPLAPAGDAGDGVHLAGGLRPSQRRTTAAGNPFAGSVIETLATAAQPRTDEGTSKHLGNSAHRWLRRRHRHRRCHNAAEGANWWRSSRPRVSAPPRHVVR